MKKVNDLMEKGKRKLSIRTVKKENEEDMDFGDVTNTPVTKYKNRRKMMQ
jgi:hypothetical protein